MPAADALKLGAEYHSNIITKTIKLLIIRWDNVAFIRVITASILMFKISIKKKASGQTEALNLRSCHITDLA
ncbi:MAG: hypothetical protein ACI9FO_001513 [Methylophagaceae bacterium]|jgi:hypothetical protein